MGSVDICIFIECRSLRLFSSPPPPFHHLVRFYRSFRCGFTKALEPFLRSAYGEANRSGKLTASPLRMLVRQAAKCRTLSDQLSFHNEFLLKKAAKRNDGGQENKTREHEKSSTSSIAYPFKEAQEKREKTKERKNRKKREQK